MNDTPAPATPAACVCPFPRDLCPLCERDCPACSAAAISTRPRCDRQTLNAEHGFRRCDLEPGHAGRHASWLLRPWEASNSVPEISVEPSRTPREANIAAGVPQCGWYLPRPENGGRYNCMLAAGHDGQHYPHGGAVTPPPAWREGPPITCEEQAIAGTTFHAPDPLHASGDVAPATPLDRPKTYRPTAKAAAELRHCETAAPEPRAEASDPEEHGGSEPALQPATSTGHDDVVRRCTVPVPHSKYPGLLEPCADVIGDNLACQLCSATRCYAHCRSVEHYKGEPVILNAIVLVNGTLELRIDRAGGRFVGHLVAEVDGQPPEVVATSDDRDYAPVVAQLEAATKKLFGPPPTQERVPYVAPTVEEIDLAPSIAALEYFTRLAEENGAEEADVTVARLGIAALKLAKKASVGGAS